MENRDALGSVMNAALTTKTAEHWVEELEAAGVPCGPVYDYAQTFTDPQVHHPFMFGQRNAEIFGGLGLNDAEMRRLRETGVL
jgi:crotonobetainyl-CoA:carnitine CoA-transferase CaiB-like acyl-CoA transferase